MTASRNDLMNLDPYDSSWLAWRVFTTDELTCSASLLQSTLLLCDDTSFHLRLPTPSTVRTSTSNLMSNHVVAHQDVIRSPPITFRPPCHYPLSFLQTTASSCVESNIGCVLDKGRESTIYKANRISNHRAPLVLLVTHSTQSFMLAMLTLTGIMYESPYADRRTQICQGSTTHQPLT